MTLRPVRSKIAHEGIAKIALQARDAAESGNQAEAQFGKGKARHLVGDDHVAGQRKLEAAAETHAVNRSDGDERCGIDGVEDRVNALKKCADTGETFLFGQLLRRA